VNLDWTGLRAVVIESDDWGTLRVGSGRAGPPRLERSAGVPQPGRPPLRRLHLESAADVKQLAGDARFVPRPRRLPAGVAGQHDHGGPDYAAMHARQYDFESLPLVPAAAHAVRAGSGPASGTKWRRRAPAACGGSSFTGSTIFPSRRGSRLSRRGADDARRAFEHQSPVCAAVEASGEYDPSEPASLRERHLTQAAERFRVLAGRAPSSLCPPDYRWSDALEEQAEGLGITAIQGKSEQHGARWPRARRWWHRRRWPRFRGRRLYLPPRSRSSRGRATRAPASPPPTGPRARPGDAGSRRC